MKLPKLLAASNNQGKILEIKDALKGIFDPILSLKEADIAISPEETGSAYLENALIKASAAANFWNGWIIADDSGLEVDALEGRPGIFSSRFAGENATDEENNQKLLVDLQEIPPEKRTALFRCVVVLAHGKGGRRLTAEGSCKGLITQSREGTGGFGYDPIFFLPEMKRTMAELSFEEKMQVSHRAIALAALRKLIFQR
jgi:XTP/dITP diphosphohydrolase